MSNVLPETMEILGKIYSDITFGLEEVRFDHPWKTVALRWTDIRFLRYMDIIQFKGQLGYLDIFFAENPLVFMFPLSFLGVLQGFGFRSVENKAFTNFRFHSVAAYSSHAFIHYSNAFKFTDPIIVVEGASDAEAVSHFYPWVIATLGSGVKNLLARTFPLATRKICLMFDNDTSGRRGTQRAMKSLRGIEVEAVPYPSRYKDPAEVFVDNPDILKMALGSYAHEIKTTRNGG